MSKQQKKILTNEATNILIAYNFVDKRPVYHYEVIGKPTLIRRIFGAPFGNWDIVGIRKVRDE